MRKREAKRKASPGPRRTTLMDEENVPSDYGSSCDIGEEKTLMRKRIETGYIEEDGEFNEAESF